MLGLDTAAPRAATALRLRINPAPRCIADTRGFLRVLQQYGRVDTFRWLKHDPIGAPNVCMAIFAEQEAADRVLNDRPLTFSLDHGLASRAVASAEDLPGEEDDWLPDAGHATEKHHDTTHNPTDRPRTAARQFEDYRHRPQLFRVMPEVWQQRHRRDWHMRHPYWGSFVPEDRSISAQDLRRRVPLIGLSDINPWSRFDMLPRVLRARRAEQIAATRPTVRQMIEGLRGAEVEKQDA